LRKEEALLLDTKLYITKQKSTKRGFPVHLFLATVTKSRHFVRVSKRKEDKKEKKEIG
jgi:hypothetical protein